MRVGMHRSRNSRGVFAVLVLVVLFIAAITWRIGLLNASFARQNDVLAVSRFNDRVLQLQLDEETGIRGYQATGQRALLEPYAAASARLDAAMASLAAGVERLGVPAAGTSVDALRSTHTAWMREVALPTLRDRSAHTAQLEVRGKAILDRFRAASAALGSAIELRAKAANERTAGGLIGLTVTTGLAALAAAWFIAGSFRRHDRLLNQIEVEQTVIEKIPQMVWTKDARGRFDSGNHRFLEYMNVTLDEVARDPWIVTHPDDVARAQDSWQVAVEADTPYEAELRLRPRNGSSYRWFIERAVPHRDASGRIVRWFGTTTDIDAKQRAIAAMDFLAHSGTRLAGVQDVSVVLDRLAHASLEGLADISIFDLEDGHGNFRRLVLAAPSVPREAIEATAAFEAPRPGEPHPIARAMLQGTTIHVPDVDEAFILRSVSPVKRQEAWRMINIRSIVCVPMRIPGRVLGALTLVRTRAGVPFEAPEVRIVEEVARRAAVAIDNIRLSEREQSAARDLQVFADLGESIAESVGRQSMLDAAMAVIVPQRADWAYVNLTDEQGEVRLAAVYHPDESRRRVLSQFVGDVYTRDGAENTALEAMRTRSPVFRDRANFEGAARVVDQRILDAIWHIGIASFIVVPLFGGSVLRGSLHVCMQTAERAFQQTDVDFLAEFARRLAPAIANAELFERERRVAQSFQAAALPSSLPRVRGVAFHAIYEAGKAEALVGGDWYDAFALPNGQIVVSIGDVAGSGLSAAVTMASIRQAIRGAAYVSTAPGVMLDAADHVLEGADSRFVTAFVGVFDPATSTLTYQSAGHPPPLLRLPTGELIALALGGPPLGLRSREVHETRMQSVPPGSLLVLYTDGLIESTHDILEGEQRLRRALAGATVDAAGDPAQMLHDLVLTDGSHDDVAILTMNVG
jgi:PAS domain S-box-containing protein